MMETWAEVGDLGATRAVLTILEARMPGTCWDLLQWDDTGRASFMLGRLQRPHPGLERIDESGLAPPLVLDLQEEGLCGRQLSLGFDASCGQDPFVDWFWPLGDGRSAPWICGRIRREQATELKKRREQLGRLFTDLAAGWTPSAKRLTEQHRECQSIIHHPDSPLVELLERLARLARTETPVFLEGESGVGKELFAQALHDLSPRRGAAFVAQNGGALTDTLIESELFGHSRGSFTGAREERVGLFEMACGGTFFLDEVGDLSPMLQVRLLRVIQDRQIRRVGENRLRSVDFRLVTATHHDMESLVDGGRFRLDLWYRIQGVRLRIPPLRDRPMDVPVLALAFLKNSAEEYGLALRDFSDDALSVLKRYSWPGNVRELRNEIARVGALHGELPRVERWMLSEELYAQTGDDLPAGFKGLTLQEAQEDLERRMIRQMLGRYAGNRSRSARALGLSRQGLLKKLKRLDMERVALKGA